MKTLHQGYISMLLAHLRAPKGANMAGRSVSPGRVRLSVVVPDGMIAARPEVLDRSAGEAWHPDARVVENGRLILHASRSTERASKVRYIGSLY